MVQKDYQKCSQFRQYSLNSCTKCNFEKSLKRGGFKEGVQGYFRDMRDQIISFTEKRDFKKYSS